MLSVKSKVLTGQQRLNIIHEEKKSKLVKKNGMFGNGKFLAGRG